MAEPNAAAVEHLYTGLGFFKDWSNYLLVTTVASVGWLASDKAAALPQDWKNICIWLMVASIAFGIFTLALIPLVTEGIPVTVFENAGRPSFYEVYGEFHLFWFFGPIVHAKLPWVCGPQHATFLAGIICYAYAATRGGA